MSFVKYGLPEKKKLCALNLDQSCGIPLAFPSGSVFLPGMKSKSNLWCVHSSL